MPKYTDAPDSSAVPLAVQPAGRPASAYPLSYVAPVSGGTAYTDMTNLGYYPAYSTDPVPVGKGRA